MNLSDLKKAWENKKQILEGLKNTLIKDEIVENIAKERDIICQGCDFIDRKGDKCFLPGSQPCCGKCGCKLHFKQRSLSSSCPEGFWGEIISEEEENNLNS